MASTTSWRVMKRCTQQWIFSCCNKYTSVYMYMHLYHKLMPIALYHRKMHITPASQCPFSPCTCLKSDFAAQCIPMSDDNVLSFRPAIQFYTSGGGWHVHVSWDDVCPPLSSTKSYLHPSRRHWRYISTDDHELYWYPNCELKGHVSRKIWNFNVFQQWLYYSHKVVLST